MLEEALFPRKLSPWFCFSNYFFDYCTVFYFLLEPDPNQNHEPDGIPIPVPAVTVPQHCIKTTYLGSNKIPVIKRKDTNVVLCPFHVTDKKPNQLN
jgi:hypothetical protein